MDPKIEKLEKARKLMIEVADSLPADISQLNLAISALEQAIAEARS